MPRAVLRLRPGVLERAVAERCSTLETLATEAGVGVTTVQAVNKGRPATPQVMAKIRDWLASNPVDPGLVAMLEGSA